MSVQKLLWINIVLLGCLRLGAAQHPNVPQHLPDDVQQQMLQRLPDSWRSPVERFHVLDDFQVRYVFAELGHQKFLAFYSGDKVRYRALRVLAQVPGAEDFVLDNLGSLPSDLRIYMYVAIADDSHDLWVNNSRVISVLEKAATGSHKEADAALKTIQMLEARRFRKALDPALNSEKVDDAILEQAQRLDYLLDGVDVPESLQKPPKVFAAIPDKPSIRVAVLGDFGSMGPEHAEQVRVAEAMVQYSKKQPFDLGITVGDNFYFRMESPYDPLWKVDFEDLYDPLGITFYPSFGNHDWDERMPEIELLHSGYSTHWKFPSPYYTYTAGPVQFFVINTDDLESRSHGPAQLAWLKSELAASKAPWKIVYGHYPIKDNARGLSPGLSRVLLPVLKGHADVYLAGHIHNMEHLKPEEGVNLFIAGGSGQAGSAGEAFNSETFFVSEGNLNGFAVLDATDQVLTVRFLDDRSHEIYKATLKK